MSVTTGRMSEAKALMLLEYMKKTINGVEYYDDHGYHGLSPSPHEINSFWKLNQGEIYIKWNGVLNTTNDGLDVVEIELRNKVFIEELHDEEWWRSEVD